jgi:hypothetical protein
MRRALYVLLVATVFSVATAGIAWAQLSLAPVNGPQGDGPLVTDCEGNPEGECPEFSTEGWVSSDNGRDISTVYNSPGGPRADDTYQIRDRSRNGRDACAKLFDEGRFWRGVCDRNGAKRGYGIDYVGRNLDAHTTAEGWSDAKRRYVGTGRKHPHGS